MRDSFAPRAGVEYVENGLGTYDQTYPEPEPESETVWETVTLRVPRASGDLPAREWDWTDLVGAGEPVTVVK